MKDNIQYSNQIIYKIKCGKGKEGYIDRASDVSRGRGAAKFR